MSNQDMNVMRKERLKKLAMESFDLSKDPYFFKNHLGNYSCRLCLTVHPTESNYLSHTQGKKHQTNLARRVARENRNNVIVPQRRAKISNKKINRIGKPGYRVIKQLDPDTK